MFRGEGGEIGLRPEDERENEKPSDEITSGGFCFRSKGMRRVKVAVMAMSGKKHPKA